MQVHVQRSRLRVIDIHMRNDWQTRTLMFVLLVALYARVDCGGIGVHSMRIIAIDDDTTMLLLLLLLLAFCGIPAGRDGY